MAKKRLVGWALAVLVAGAGCAKKDDCAICSDIAAKCSWSSSAEAGCKRTCSAAQSHTAECQTQYDAAFACFNDESSWDCSSTAGLVGCDSELAAYAACTGADLGPTNGGDQCVAPAGCAVCEQLTQRCGAAFSTCACKFVCGSEVTAKAGCEAALATATACLARPETWNCSSAMNDGCQDELRMLDICQQDPNLYTCYVLEAVAGDWTSITTLPKVVNAFAVDPADTSRVLAATGDSASSGAGVFATSDAGLSWVKVGAGLPADRVRTITSSAAEPGVTFVAAGEAVYVSRDGGATFTPATTSYWAVPAPDVLLADAWQPGLLYGLVASDGVLRSADYGASWEAATVGLPSAGGGSVYVGCLAAPPDSPGVLYVGTGAYGQYGNGVYRSSDAGQSWVAANAGMLDAVVVSLHAGPEGRVYAADDLGHIFVSADAGATWKKSAAELPCADDPMGSSSVLSLGGLPTVPEDLYVLTGSARLIHTSDGGASWELLVKARTDWSFGADQAVLTLLPAPPPVVLAGIGGRYDASNALAVRYVAAP